MKGIRVRAQQWHPLLYQIIFLWLWGYCCIMEIYMYNQPGTSITIYW